MHRPQSSPITRRDAAAKYWPRHPEACEPPLPRRLVLSWLGSVMVLGNLLLCSIAPAIAQSPTHSKATAPGDGKSVICVEMQMGNHVYCFPKAALEIYQRSKLRQDVVAMSLMMPDLRLPTPEDNRRFFLGEMSRGMAKTSIALTAHGPPISWDQAVRNRIKGGGPVPVEVPGPFGLVELVGGFPRSNPYANEFVAERDGFRFTISCGFGGVDGRPHSPGLVPTCRSEIPFRDLKVILHFPAGHLDQWKKLHDDVISKITAWTRD